MHHNAVVYTLSLLLALSTGLCVFDQANAAESYRWYAGLGTGPMTAAGYREYYRTMAESVTGDSPLYVPSYKPYVAETTSSGIKGFLGFDIPNIEWLSVELAYVGFQGIHAQVYFVEFDTFVNTTSITARLKYPLTLARTFWLTAETGVYYWNVEVVRYYEG